MKIPGLKKPVSLSYFQKLLLFVIVSVLAVCSFIFGYFVVHMRRQMSDYVRSEVNYSMEQTTIKIQSELDNLQRIMYTTLMDSYLWQRLSAEYTDPMDTWELYDYVNRFYDTLLAMDDRIALVTIYVDNPTIAEDKTYIRQFDYFEKLPVYEQVKQANGAVVMFPMTDVFPDEYYEYNYFSSRQDFCLLRTSVYRGIHFGVVVEFSRNLFTDHLSALYGNQVFLLDPAERIVLYLNHGADQTNGVYGTAFQQRTSDDIRQQIDFRWNIAVQDHSRLLTEVDSTIVRMTLYAGAVILLMLLLMAQLLWRFTAKLRSLDATIRSTMSDYGGPATNPRAGGDELDQALLSFQALKDRINYLMNEVMEKELAHRDAELRLLYSQIKPHFLYNTLSCVMSLARRYHDERLETMISSLSDIYRISLNRGKENITVADELQLTRSYLYIIQNRFDDMLQVSMETEPEIEPSMVPKVILQPFIENCVNHAIRGDEVLHIRIRGVRQGEDVTFTVEDDGLGIQPETIQSIFDDGPNGIGFGVRNVHHRIQMLYGQEYGVTLQASPEGGTLAMLKLRFCLSDGLREEHTFERNKSTETKEDTNHGHSYHL